MTVKRAQAFKQAPWRNQLRFTGATMLWIMVLLVLGGMYLAVSAKLADVGRQVLELEEEREELLDERDDLSVDLAQLTSPQRMSERAGAMGFRPAGASDVEYLKLEGYVEAAPFIAPRPISTTRVSGQSLSPAYTETLIDRVERMFGEGGAE